MPPSLTFPHCKTRAANCTRVQPFLRDYFEIHLYTCHQASQIIASRQFFGPAKTVEAKKLKNETKHIETKENVIFGG